MTESTSDEIKAIRVLPFSGLQRDWDEWSEKFQGIASEQGYLEVMLGTQQVPDQDVNIDERNEEGNYVRPEAERLEQAIGEMDEPERLLRLATCYIKIGFPDCVFGQDNGVAKWMSGYSMEWIER